VDPRNHTTPPPPGELLASRREPDVIYFDAYFANFGDFWPFEGLLKALEGPLGTPNQSFYYTYVVLNVIYPFHAI
jgi:hypothetical protein